jgi:hypothetical protein
MRAVARRLRSSARASFGWFEGGAELSTDGSNEPVAVRKDLEGGTKPRKDRAQVVGQPMACVPDPMVEQGLEVVKTARGQRPR